MTRISVVCLFALRTQKERRFEAFGFEAHLVVVLLMRMMMM